MSELDGRNEDARCRLQAHCPDHIGIVAENASVRAAVPIIMERIEALHADVREWRQEMNAIRASNGEQNVSIAEIRTRLSLYAAGGGGAAGLLVLVGEWLLGRIFQ